MKKHLLIICLLLTFGCSKTAKNYDYEFNVNDVFFQVPPGRNTFETHVFVINNVNTFLSQYMSTKNQNVEDIKNIASGRANISGRYNSIDMGFVREVRVRLVDTDNPSEYQEIFQRTNIPPTGEFNLALNPTLADIKSFISKEKVNVEVRMIFRRIPPTFIPLDLDFSYAVIL